MDDFIYLVENKSDGNIVKRFHVSWLKVIEVGKVGGAGGWEGNGVEFEVKTGKVLWGRAKKFKVYWKDGKEKVTFRFLWADAWSYYKGGPWPGNEVV
jgi:hypothetical protein